MNDDYLDINTVKFPIIILQKGFVLVAPNKNRLTESKKSALKQKWFNEMVFVDADLMLYRIQSAEKVRGIGPFWGYNIFLNQKIEVRLWLKNNPEKFGLDELKSLILDSTKAKELWRTREDYELLMSRIREVQSYETLIALVR